MGRRRPSTPGVDWRLGSLSSRSKGYPEPVLTERSGGRTVGKGPRYGWTGRPHPTCRRRGRPSVRSQSTKCIHEGTLGSVCSLEGRVGL